MIVGVSALIAVSIINCVCIAIDGVLSTWIGDGLARVVDPIGGGCDTWRNIVAGHNRDVVRTVVWRSVFPAIADFFDGTV